MQTFRYTLSLVLGIAITYALQRWDRGRLSPAQREAAWNGATWGAALYAFGPLSMLGWAWVTRRDLPLWRRPGAALRPFRIPALLLGGLMVAAGIVMVVAGADWLIEQATERSAR